MKQNALIFLLLLSFSTSVKIFLVGGMLADNNTEVFNAIASSTSKRPQPNKCSTDWNTTNCPKIAVITSAASNSTAAKQAFQVDLPDKLGYKNLFLMYGMSPKLVQATIDTYAKNTDTSTEIGKQNLKILVQCDIVFFNGGDQGRHSRTWLYDNGLPNALMTRVIERAGKKQIVLVGTSAGSMEMPQIVFGSGSSFGHLYFSNSIGLAPKQIKDSDVNGSGLLDVRNGTLSLQYYQNGGKVKGLGFTKFVVDTHFDNRGRLGRLIPDVIDLNKKIGVGVDQNTCLLLKDDQIGQVLGERGVFLVDLTEAKQNRTKGYFQVLKARVHYLTTGDSYNFDAKKVTSSKPRITSPYYNGPTDSSDILSPYETTKVITRLVDQRSQYNVGRTRTPSGFPSRTPQFTFKFYRDDQTKGYYSDHKYTADSILVDITTDSRAQLRKQQ